MDDYLFFRVEDENSQARTLPGRGVMAGDTNAEITFDPLCDWEENTLRRSLSDHLDWSYRYPTPFISAYSDEATAVEEAERRKQRGMRHVTITVIDVAEAWEEVEGIEVRMLADGLRLWIPEEAWNNSKYEYVFLHRIPERAVIDYFRV
jgi:hypothetical protein